MKEQETYDLAPLISMGMMWNLKINPKIERKYVNGRWGMFATEPIESSEVLISSNTPAAILHKGYDEMVGKYSVEFEKGKDAYLTPWFDTLKTDIDSFKENATYYATDDELETLSKISLLIHSKVRHYIKNISTKSDEISKEYKCSKESAEIMLLMKDSRAWGAGFMPGFDLFNHNARRGNPMYIIEEEGQPLYMFLSRGAYAVGEEIFVSYDANDSMKYCINYNFFDETDIHTVNILQRLFFNADDENGQVILNRLKESVGIAEHDIDGKSVFQIKSAAPLMAGNLCTDLLDIATQFALDEDGNVQDETLTETLMNWLQYSSHNVLLNTLREEQLTPRIKRFLNCISADNRAIQQCWDWVILNSKVYSNTFLRDYKKN